MRARILRMKTLHELLAEIEMEATATGRLLERVPAGRLAWRPHPKSMTLGQLALHVATIPASYAGAIAGSAAEAAEIVIHPECNSLDDLRRAWTNNLASVRELLGRADDGEAPFSIAQNGKALLTLPKANARRIFVLNHWYHHRGQLTVYLRLLDIAIPSIYGPSADENPFEAAAAA